MGSQISRRSFALPAGELSRTRLPRILLPIVQYELLKDNFKGGIIISKMQHFLAAAEYIFCKNSSQKCQTCSGFSHPPNQKMRLLLLLLLLLVFQLCKFSFEATPIFQIPKRSFEGPRAHANSMCKQATSVAIHSWQNVHIPGFYVRQ